MSSYTRQQLEAWLKKIDVKADSVLDIGGSQNPVVGRTKSWEVGDYKILDLAEPHEIKQKPDIEWDIQESDFYGSIRFRPYLQKFDIIFCLEVSEYWYRPYNALRNITYLIKPGGLLYISFHFIYPEHEPVKYDYLRYTPHGAVKLLQTAGFTIIGNNARMAQNSRYLSAFYGSERMRPSQYANFSIIGSLITAKKEV